MMDVNLTLLAPALAAPADDDDDDDDGAVSGAVSGEVVKDEAASGIGDRLIEVPTSPLPPLGRDRSAATTAEVGDRSEEAALAVAAAVAAAVAVAALAAASSLHTA